MEVSCSQEVARGLLSLFKTLEAAEIQASAQAYAIQYHDKWFSLFMTLGRMFPDDTELLRIQKAWSSSPSPSPEALGALLLAFVKWLGPKYEQEPFKKMLCSVVESVDKDVAPDDKQQAARSTPGWEHGYRHDLLTQPCGIPSLVRLCTYVLDDQKAMSMAMPADRCSVGKRRRIRILTWNIWGLKSFRSEKDQGHTAWTQLLMLRMEQVVLALKRQRPDLAIFQEMTHEALAHLQFWMQRHGIVDDYTGYNPSIDMTSPESMKSELGRRCDLSLFCKISADFRPECIWQYNLSGNLGYTSPVWFVAFRDFSVVMTHLQAGSRHSMGQVDAALQYSRCRVEQLSSISKLMTTLLRKDRPLVFCGDLNMDLDGSFDEWPERKYLFGHDAWREVHRDIKRKPGWTEDTSRNHMRWQVKKTEKKFRFDGIFLGGFDQTKTRLVSKRCYLVGTQAYSMPPALFRSWTEALGMDPKSEVEVRSATYHASDHFGVLVHISLEKVLAKRNMWRRKK